MPVETAERGSPQQEHMIAGRTLPSAIQNKPVPIEPDLAFIRTLMKTSGDSLKKCMQCGTCSATCALSSDVEPFPRKEMAWAVWGMRETLLEDPDIWLCYQCNDCSTRCPRSAKPGDVMAAVRQEWVIRQAIPRFLARWARQPQSAPLLVGIIAALLGMALYLKDPIANVLGISELLNQKIVYSYSSMMPRWLLNIFFPLLGFLVMLPVIRGIVRLWRAMKAAAVRSGVGTPPLNLLRSIWSALKSIVSHNRFALCTQSHSRFWSHLPVFFGFLALSLVTLWVITAPHNPLITREFVYPFSFWNPWKVLANAGGIAIVVGCILMIKDRMKRKEQAEINTYSDWSLIAVLLAVVLTGFTTEALHYVRLEPHRHLAYFVHLVFAGVLLLYMPYSKFAHIIYRTVALVCAERYNRINGKQMGESQMSEVQ